MTTPSARPIPRSRAELSAAWLTEALVAAGRLEDAEPIDFESRRIGADFGFTCEIAHVQWWSKRRGSSARGTLVAKMPFASQPFERRVREVRFYELIGDDVGLPVPRMIFAAVDEASSRMILLLEEIPGHTGDAAAGCTPAETRMIMNEVARMHAKWWRSPELDRHDWLPRWGSGESGAARPHRRRAARFQKMTGPFLAAWADTAPPALVRLIEELGDPCEGILARLADLPPTLIHVDLHLDNIIFRKDADGQRNGFVLIDWQSVSAGPGIYDLARLLIGTIDESAHPGISATLANEYHDALTTAGVDIGPREEFDRTLRYMLLSVLVGFVSGYGGRDVASLVERERAMIRRSTSPQGLGGVVLALTGGRID